MIFVLVCYNVIPQQVSCVMINKVLSSYLIFTSYKLCAFGRNSQLVRTNLIGCVKTEVVFTSCELEQFFLFPPNMLCKV